MPVYRRDTTRARRGDFLRIDDRSGFYEWASNTSKEWNGQIVAKRSFEARHPQDFVRGVREDFRVPDPRPDIVNPATAPSVGSVNTTIAADLGGDYARIGLMGALGEFAIGQGDDGGRGPSNAAGSNEITVASTAGMAPLDSLGVVLDDGTVFRVQIKSFASPFVIQLTAILPGPCSVGNSVFDYTAAPASPVSSYRGSYT